MKNALVRKNKELARKVFYLTSSIAYFSAYKPLYIALCTTYLDFALPYFALGAISIVFACAIKTR